MSTTSYRYEIAKQGRAGCQNSACKAADIKIAKGELRFGTLVMFQEHTTWKWKHWGCVTPVQIGNIIGQIGGLDGLDLDKDLDILDGYEDLPDWAQDKIKYALENGHVHDDDWKGDPELNRPGQKGINKRTPKKKQKSDEEDDSTAVDSPVKPKKSAKKKAVKAEDGGEDVPEPKKKATKKRKAAAVDDEDEKENPPTKATQKKSKSKTIAIKDEDISADELVPAKKSRSKKVKQEANDNDDIDNKIVQTDGPPEKKRKRSSAAAAKAKSQDEDAEDDVPLKPTKSAKAKKAKAEPVEDDDVLDDVDKKKQNRSKRGKGRGKGAAVVPEDEVTDARQPVEPKEAVVDEEEAEVKAPSRKKKGGRKSKA